MAIRARAISVVLLGLAMVLSCDRAPSSPTSSNLSLAMMLPTVVEVGSSVQDISGQAFLLLGNSLAQQSSLSAAQDSGPTPNDFTSAKTINWSMACPDGGTRSVTGTVSV